MARIPFPDPAVQPDELRDRLRRLGGLNVTRMMSHAPALMVAYSKLGSHLLLRGSLDPVLREAVILRIGQLCGSDYEWHQHVGVARAVGMAEPMLAAIERRDDDALPEAVRLAVQVARELYRDHAVAPATFERVRATFSAEQIVELMLLPGFYIMTAGFLRSLDVEVEDTDGLGASFVTRPGPANEV